MSSSLNKISNGIYSFIRPYSNYIIWFLRILIAAGIIYMVWKIVSHAAQTNFLHKNMLALYKNIEKNAKSRVKASAQRKKMYGEQESTSMLDRLDSTLKYSGLQRKNKWLTAELFAIFVLIIEIFTFIITCILLPVMLIRLLIPVCLLIVIGSYLSMRRKRIYKAANSQINIFANLISNYASSSDDIVLVLQKAASMIKNPLKSIILESCNEARRTGNTMAALKSLEDSLEYSPFKAIIRNLSIAARNEANYKDVINSNRGVIQNRISAENELSNIYKTARLELLLVLLFGTGGIVVLSKAILGKSFFVLIREMVAQPMGQAVLTVFSLSIIVSLYFTVVHTEKGGR